MVGLTIGGTICQGSSPTALGISVGYFDTIADLRAETETFISSVSVFVAGQTSAVDGYGGMYTYDPASTAADDGYTTIQQTNSTGAGRWILDPAYTTESVFALDSGAVNAVAVPRMTLAPTGRNGTLIGVRIAYTNTGATTLTDGVTIWDVTQGGVALSGGELVVGYPALFEIDNGYARLVYSGSGALNVGTPTASTHAAQKGQVDTLSTTVTGLPGVYANINGSATQNFNVLKAAASDNTNSAASTSWIWTNIQALVTSVIAAVATAAGFSISPGLPGHIIFPSWLGGLILQWGTGTINANVGTIVSFPLAFPNSAWIVQATNASTDGTNNSLAASIFSKSQFNLQYDSTTSSITYYFFAIGN
ncbi:MAG: hypothetical protein KGL20_05170 [Rhodospirillales bacterium]|nr:hypothetical protein [Rhodospirillales bacterium]